SSRRASRPRAIAWRSAATCSRWVTPCTSIDCSTPCAASTRSTTCIASTRAERGAEALTRRPFAGEVAPAVHRAQDGVDLEAADLGEPSHDRRLVLAEVGAESREIDSRAQRARDRRLAPPHDVAGAQMALDHEGAATERRAPPRSEVDEELAARGRMRRRTPDPGGRAERRDEARRARAQRRDRPGSGNGRDADGHVALTQPV